MKFKHVAAAALFISFGVRPYAQNSGRGKAAIHLYPTTTIAGDISFGAEHYFRERLSHELSFNLKVLPHSWYDYDEGYRVNYLLKYEIVSKQRFGLSAGVAIDHWNIWYDDKRIEYYAVDLGTSKTPADMYLAMRESKNYKTFGAGLAIGPTLYIGKTFLLGGDLQFFFCKANKRKAVNEVLYVDPDFLHHHPEGVQGYENHSRSTFIPFVRAKIGYIIG